MDTSSGSTAPSTGPETIPADPEKALHSRQDAISRRQKSESNKFHFLRPTVHGVAALFRGKGALAPFRLLKSDFNGRAKIYHMDWGFNQLILASAVYVFFTNLLPGITFASDLYVLTGRNYGAIEVVFSTGLCGIIFALFSGQPLTILGVTGPFCILSERIYALCHEDFHIPYLPFMAWACIHSAWMHWLLAIFNAHDWTMEYVTTFSTEIFSLLNSVIYFHKAVQELERSHANTSFASFLYSIIGCVGTFLVAVTLSTANSWAPLFHKYVRMGLAEYAAAISIVIFIAMPHIGELNSLDQQRLPVSTSFRPTSPERTRFIVEFWTLPASWIFAAILPGLIITTLFFFDVEVSTICATLSRYNIRKPGGYAWDVALLGTTTALCGILGIPPANGLLPQAPLHSESLLHSEEVNVNGETKNIQTVYEQRWSHLLHAIGIMLFVSPPFMHVLGLTPTSVLAGLFLYMGEQSLSVNPILFRFFHMLTPSSELPQLPDGIRGYRGIHMYTLLQIVITAGIFAVTFTPGAPVFPVIIVLLVPIRLNLMNKWWSRETLKRRLYSPHEG
ncbi:HCO3 transporter family-domain-containing protein [Tuber indicum]|nr:HCO3 transporter family-domain-containing protein [Tuber indicum]